MSDDKVKDLWPCCDNQDEAGNDPLREYIDSARFSNKVAKYRRFIEDYQPRKKGDFK